MKRLSHLVLLANLLVSPSIAGAHEVTLDIDDAVSTACKSLDQKLSRESRSNIRIALHISNHLSLLDEQNQIGNIAVGHLESRKVTLFGLSPVQDSNEKKLGEFASSQGADYLLTFNILDSHEHPSLRLKLLQVDRGLWHRVDEVNPVVFQKTIQFRRTKNPLITALKKPNVRKLRTIAGEVVSLSNCELLKNSSGEELIVVTTSEILVFGQRDDFLRILGRFPLQRALSRSTFRSRYPHGFARCTESNDGTKSLLLTQSGYTGMATLVFNEANISNPEFLLQQESVQITSSKGIETFEYTPRRPWFKASHDKSKRPSRAYLEFAFPKVDTTYALLSDYTIHRLGTEAIPTTVQHTSGLGFSAFTGKDNGINFVTTSSLAADKTDRIKVIRESDGTVVQEANLPGRVKASSILRNTLAGRSRIILALRSNSGRLSQLFEWEILE